MQRLVVAALVMTALAGCLNNDDGEAPPHPGAAGPMHGLGHPYPDGDEWPIIDGEPLAGPFGILAPENVRIPSFDGTELNTWIVRPDLPAGVGAPVVVWSAPYFGQQYPAGNDPALYTNANEAHSVPVNVLVENGFAVAILNLRGSGTSGGCLTWMAHLDGQDLAAASEWLAAQEWSNGHVGHMGLSWHGTTPFQAASNYAPSIKAIVTAGMVSNLYTFYHTPQGAALAIGGAFGTAVGGIVGGPPIGTDPEHIITQYPFVVPERVCSHTQEVLTEFLMSQVLPRRDTEFWEDRKMSDLYSNIDAAVLMTHGFRDYMGSGHAFQEDDVWSMLRPEVPKYFIIGQWGHMFPNFADSWTDTRESWDDIHVQWFDYWLKGIGTPPRLGVTEYQDDNLDWHTSTSWPPTEAVEEVLYIGDSLGTGATGEGNTFLSVPTFDEIQPLACGGGLGAGTTSIVASTAPAAGTTLLAGNPFLYLEVTSNLPGGLISAYLVETGPEAGGCGDGGRMLAHGGADLRWIHDNLQPIDFPVGTPTWVRLDMTNLAESIEPGNSVTLVLAYSEVGQYATTDGNPQLTISGASELILPVITGGFGGDPPRAAYPPKPSMPDEMFG